MITKTQESEFVRWFHQYVKTFQQNDCRFQRNIDLKNEHILKVRNVITELAISEKLSGDQICLARVMALFHDIGRFRQYAKYRTFSDRNSENHALLGIRELQKNKVLESLEKDDRTLIVTAIANHNRKEIPPETTGKAFYYSAMLRDADKIDIWRVVTDYYEDPNTETNSALQLDLPDNPEYSFRILEDVENGRSIRMENMKTLNDFKLLQIGWVFDLHFKKSFEIVKKRRFIERIIGVLPDEKPIRQLEQKISNFIDKKTYHE